MQLWCSRLKRVQLKVSLVRLQWENHNQMKLMHQAKTYVNITALRIKMFRGSTAGCCFFSQLRSKNTVKLCGFVFQHLCQFGFIRRTQLSKSRAWLQTVNGSWTFFYSSGKKANFEEKPQEISIDVEEIGEIFLRPFKALHVIMYCMVCAKQKVA